MTKRQDGHVQQTERQLYIPPHQTLRRHHINEEQGVQETKPEARSVAFCPPAAQGALVHEDGYSGSETCGGPKGGGVADSLSARVPSIPAAAVVFPAGEGLTLPPGLGVAGAVSSLHVAPMYQMDARRDDNPESEAAIGLGLTPMASAACIPPPPQGERGSASMTAPSPSPDFPLSPDVTPKGAATAATKMLGSTRGSTSREPLFQADSHQASSHSALLHMHRTRTSPTAEHSGQ